MNPVRRKFDLVVVHPTFFGHRKVSKPALTGEIIASFSTLAVRFFSLLITKQESVSDQLGVGASPYPLFRLLVYVEIIVHLFIQSCCIAGVHAAKRARMALLSVRSSTRVCSGNES